MFSDINENYRMILGAYKKTKGYYYYNKNFVFMKKKIAEFEFDSSSFEEKIWLLAKVLVCPEQQKSLIDSWIDKINIYFIPKGFERNENNPSIIRGIKKEEPVVNKVNFFIDIPIELYILDVLWTILIGKDITDNDKLSQDIYGNKLDKYVLYNQANDEYIKSVNFDKNNCFQNYFLNYCKWKNNAISAIDEAYKEKREMVLASLDIQGYFYSVCWDFDILDNYVQSVYLNQLNSLTNIIKQVYSSYQEKLLRYRVLRQQNGQTVLPIGLFSSMFLSNVYLDRFDKYIRSLDKVIYYGRYVDDILILIDTSDYSAIKEELLLRKILVEDNQILVAYEDYFYLKEYENLIIQNEKVKLLYFEQQNADSLINKLKETVIIPSQCNVVPNNLVDIADFEEAAFMISDITNNTKIRDIGQIEIDRYQLGRFLSQLVRATKYDLVDYDEKKKNQDYKDKMIRFFCGVNACEFYTNWLNCFYYLIASGKGDVKAWRQLEKNICDAIDNIDIGNTDILINRGEIKDKLQMNLRENLDICMAIALALNPNFNKTDTEAINDLTRKIRKANLFNHFLVKYPLVNYADNIADGQSFFDISINDYYDMTQKIKDSRKVKLSPRFIHIEELFFLAFLRKARIGGNYLKNSDEILNNVFDFYKKINGLYSGYDYSIVSITNEKCFDEYNLQKINIKSPKMDFSNIKIAIANLDLDVKRCCYGLENFNKEEIPFSQFQRFMADCYTDSSNHVDYLLLPEFFLPLNWIPDVLRFVRLSGVTIITGLQYITCNINNKKMAHNNIAVFFPSRVGTFPSAGMIVREKNDYAPAEKEILALNGYSCEDQKLPTYNVFECGGVSYGTFLCYEFTDIVARSLYKNKVDLLFTPEHNKDTSYFSSIIESLVRDLHVFIAQSNTSHYGDSRITGPYSKECRNIVQIKGGENDSIIIGKIDLNSLNTFEIKEMEENRLMFSKIAKMGNKEKYDRLKHFMDDPSVKISKLSARFVNRHTIN